MLVSRQKERSNKENLQRCAGGFEIFSRLQRAFYGVLPAGLILLAGCSTPQTKIVFRDPAGVVRFSGKFPKDISLKNLEILPDGTVRIGEYRARMSPDVVHAQGLRETGNIKATGETAGSIADLILKAKGLK